MTGDVQLLLILCRQDADTHFYSDEQSTFPPAFCIVIVLKSIIQNQLKILISALKWICRSWWQINSNECHSGIYNITIWSKV